jgi:hypothetical protein
MEDATTLGIVNRLPPTDQEISPATAPAASRIRIARILAIAADVAQIAVFPVFGEGFASPANTVLDVVMCGVMIALLGFHVAFLPALIAELVPVLDLFPTWTAAVLFVTRSKKES